MFERVLFYFHHYIIPISYLLCIVQIVPCIIHSYNYCCITANPNCKSQPAVYDTYNIPIITTIANEMSENDRTNCIALVIFMDLYTS